MMSLTARSSSRIAVERLVSARLARNDKGVTGQCGNKTLLEPTRWTCAVAVVVACLCCSASAHAASERTAALQAALRARGAYAGTIDGLAGPSTTAGVRRVQAHAGLVVDGIAGPRTRRA